MASVTIRNLSDDVKAALQKRAKASGESLEAFLRRLLQAEAATELNHKIDDRRAIDDALATVRESALDARDDKEIDEALHRRRSSGVAGARGGFAEE